MKRTLALAAAALLCMTGGALARHHRPQVAEIAIDGFCNVYKVTYSRWTGLATAQDTPNCTGTYGGGMIVKNANGDAVMLLALQDQVNAPGRQTMLQLSYPFVTGGAVTIYSTTDGTTFSDDFDGTYTVETGAPVNRGGKSVFTALRK